MWRSFKIGSRALMTLIVCLLFTVFLIGFPQVSREAVKRGFKICGEIVIPSLFPFTCLALFFNRAPVRRFFVKILDPITNKWLHCDGAVGLILIMSLIGGYPVGAKMIADAVKEKRLNRENGAKLLLCAVNGGPAFYLVAVGCGMLGSEKAGLLMFCDNTAACLLMATVILRRAGIKMTDKKTDIGYADALVDSVLSAAQSMITISAFVVLFSCFGSCVAAIFGNRIGSVFTVLSEVTGGAMILSDRPIGWIAALLAWGGLAVHGQIFAVCREMPIRYGPYFLSRTIHAVLGGLLAALSERVFPITRETISAGTVRGAAVTSATSAFSLALILLSVIMMFYGRLILLEQKYSLPIKKK